jgi:ElaB/YqjD/DUF883 family membrane-anchored ribosome-binding protein
MQDVIEGEATTGKLQRESAMDKLVSDVRVLMSDSEELLRATASQTGEKISQARARMQEAVTNLKPDVAKAQAAIRDNAVAAASSANEYAQDNPWLVAGVFAGVGLLIGLLIGRR